MTLLWISQFPFQFHVFLLINNISNLLLFIYTPVASLTKEVNPRLAKRPLIFNGRLVNRGLTSLVKGAIGNVCREL